MESLCIFIFRLKLSFNCICSFQLNESLTKKKIWKKSEKWLPANGNIEHVQRNNNILMVSISISTTLAILLLHRIAPSERMLRICWLPNADLFPFHLLIKIEMNYVCIVHCDQSHWNWGISLLSLRISLFTWLISSYDIFARSFKLQKMLKLDDMCAIFANCKKWIAKINWIFVWCSPWKCVWWQIQNERKIYGNLSFIVPLYLFKKNWKLRCLCVQCYSIQSNSYCCFFSLVVTNGTKIITFKSEIKTWLCVSDGWNQKNAWI